MSDVVYMRTISGRYRFVRLPECDVPAPVVKDEYRLIRSRDGERALMVPKEMNETVKDGVHYSADYH